MNPLLQAPVDTENTILCHGRNLSLQLLSLLSNHGTELAHATEPLQYTCKSMDHGSEGSEK